MSSHPVCAALFDRGPAVPVDQLSLPAGCLDQVEGLFTGAGLLEGEAPAPGGPGASSGRACR